ncbi:MAG TPA: hypothetical protein PLL78_10275 [Fimbriimonadaceae bacterium]|nr:hypothetical protein [Fimbriimonadaceae bacterium]
MPATGVRIVTMVPSTTPSTLATFASAERISQAPAVTAAPTAIVDNTFVPAQTIVLNYVAQKPAVAGVLMYTDD